MGLVYIKKYGNAAHPKLGHITGRGDSVGVVGGGGGLDCGPEPALSSGYMSVV
jgi:hypothetical protein